MFKLSILTPEKRLVTEVEVEEVVVPGFRGQLDILPGHAPLLTTLSAGVLKYRVKGEATPSVVAVSWGYMEVNPEGVVVLAETAESKEELDRPRAEEALKRAQSYLSQMTLTPDETEKYQRKIERAQVRLELADSEKLSH